MGDGALHYDATQVLRSWKAPTPRQEQLRERVVRHLEAHRDGVFRHCVPDHLTASTLVLSHDGSRVLLTLHAKARRWFQFGGHLEAGDWTLAGAAEREACEESGLELSVDHPPVHLDEQVVPFCRPSADGMMAGAMVHHLDVRFVAVARRGAVPTVTRESMDVRWWDADALPDAELTELVQFARSAVF